MCDVIQSGELAVAGALLVFCFFCLLRVNSTSRAFRRGWDAATAYYEAGGQLQREFREALRQSGAD